MDMRLEVSLGMAAFLNTYAKNELLKSDYVKFSEGKKNGLTLHLLTETFGSIQTLVLLGKTIVGEQLERFLSQDNLQLMRNADKRRMTRVFDYLLFAAQVLGNDYSSYFEGILREYTDGRDAPLLVLWNLVADSVLNGHTDLTDYTR